MTCFKILIPIVTLFICSSCGYKADPAPFFATSPSNIDNEVVKRKEEKEKNKVTNNTK